MDKFLSLKIKTKLTFGIGLLFTMIVLLGGLAVRNITDMSSDTQNILADNYNSLLYSRRMLDALERIKNDPQAHAEFEKNLDLQQKNITEIDENVATAHLVAQYEAMYQNLNDTTIQRVRMALNDIMSLNMSTIYRKSKVAEHPDADAQTLCSYAQIASVDPSPAVGGMHRFTPAMLNRLKKQRQLLSELEHALKNHEFCFFLQPKCNSMTRAIVGMEALVRWNHPTRGCVPPSEFMPLLESTGLVTQLDQYIWESVCKTLHKWQESGSNLVPVSVNVSVVDIVNLDVPQIFSNLVEKYQLEPKLLLAEITETMLAENASLVENTIQGLHRKGFSVMMDDFGSGYSSLNMLKDTNVDAIKLDMKLIDMNQQNRSKGVQIVESVVDMAHRLNLPIIAEGVETPEQVSMLQAADCLYTQGYYFYKPMPVENAEALLAQPNSEDYWDMRRDLMRRDLLRRDRRVPVSDSEQTALALQAYQIFADNVLELSLLNLSTGEYRVIKRDPRLPGAGSDTEEDFAAYCERMVTNKVIHPDDAEMFTDQTDLEALRSAVFSTQQSEAKRS